MARDYLSLTLVAVLMCGCASMASDFGSAPSGPGPTAEQVAQWQAAAKRGQEQSKKAQAEQDNAQCIEFGYKSGTTDYARCRENLYKERQAAKRTAATPAPIILPPPPPPFYRPQPVYVPQPYQIPPPVPVVRSPTVTTTCRQDAVLKGNVTCTSR